MEKNVRILLTAVSAFCLTSCGYYRDNDLGACMDMERVSGEIQVLLKKNDELERRNRKLAKNPDAGFEEIANTEIKILENRNRIQHLEDEGRRREKYCRPMFEDPQRKRAREKGYRL